MYYTFSSSEGQYTCNKLVFLAFTLFKALGDLAEEINSNMHNTKRVPLSVVWRNANETDWNRVRYFFLILNNIIFIKIQFLNFFLKFWKKFFIWEINNYCDKRSSLIKLQLFFFLKFFKNIYIKKELWKNTSYENVICAEKKRKEKKAIKCKIIKKSQKLSAVLHDSRSGEKKELRAKVTIFFKYIYIF